MSVAELSAIVVAILASTGFWAFLGKIYDNKRADKAAAKNQVNPELIKLQQEALVALLHDRIYGLGTMYVERGNITLDEFDNFCYLYKAYAGLNGNGTGEKLKHEVDKLPIVKEDPANG